jgi:hypothetical protein
MEFIPIGSDCSIAYQLTQHNLRTIAYPFDHVRIKTLATLNTILQNNFKDYTTFTPIGPKSCYQYLDSTEEITNHQATDQTIVLKNSYNVIFPHDCTNFDDQKEAITEKYARRIQRFQTLSKPTIFIWYEQCIIKQTDINTFQTIVNTIYPTLIWNLIIISKKPIQTFSNVYHYLDTTEFLDWTKSNLDWPTIFGMRSKITMNRGQICSCTIHSQVIQDFQTIDRSDTVLLYNNNIYHGNESYFLDGFEISVNHFSQSCERIHKHLSTLVNRAIPEGSNYVGFSGLAAYYAHQNKHKLANIICYATIDGIIETGNKNDVSTFAWSTYQIGSILENTTFLVNVIKVNQEFCEIINREKPERIVFITCTKSDKLESYLFNYNLVEKVNVIGIDVIVAIYFFNLI